MSNEKKAKEQENWESDVNPDYIDQEEIQEQNELNEFYAEIAENAKAPEELKQSFVHIRDAKIAAKRQLRLKITEVLDVLAEATGKDRNGNRLPSHDAKVVFEKLEAKDKFPKIFESEALQQTRHDLSSSKRPFVYRDMTTQFDRFLKSTIKDVAKTETLLVFGENDTTPEKITALIQNWEDKKGFSFKTRGDVDVSYNVAIAALRQMMMS